jgi:hypothetical protein
MSLVGNNINSRANMRMRWKDCCNYLFLLIIAILSASLFYQINATVTTIMYQCYSINTIMYFSAGSMSPDKSALKGKAKGRQLKNLAARCRDLQSALPSRVAKIQHGEDAAPCNPAQPDCRGCQDRKCW